LAQLRVSIELEQLLLDRDDFLAARLIGLLRFGEHLVRHVVVVVVAARNCSERFDQLPRPLISAGHPLEQLIRHLFSADPDAVHPQEMIAADELDVDIIGGRLELAREPALDVDRVVAETDDLCLGVASHGLRDDAARVGEVHEPRARGKLLRIAADVEHHRYRA
jgi:hypothetical protein